MRILLAASALASALLVAGPGPARADVDPYDGGWHSSFSPYLWLSGSDMTLDFKMPGGSVSRVMVSESPFDVLKTLHFAAMGAGDIRKGDWVVIADLIYASVGDGNTSVRNITFPDGSVQIPINLHTSDGLQELVVTAGAGYAVLHDGVSSADIFVGLRAAAASTKLEWRFAGPLGLVPQSGLVRNYESLWDGIVGMRGRIGIEGTPWFVPYYADIGTGESHITAQLMTGVGYTFSWGDLGLTYRYLYYRPERGGTVARLGMHGFLLGTTLRF
ncbi:MAG TPA: hypothetical protein VMU08_18800 [Rhizomicrobium sp.]|nr:hypothetical protein [Rhizomicrobium sp.]